MKQVVKVRMLPTQEQAAALQATLRTCNKAASWLSAAMHTERLRRKHEVQCSVCGWVDKHNRRSQSEFKCGRCRFVGHADHNAAINIAARGVERWGEVMRPHAAPTPTAS